MFGFQFVSLNARFWDEVAPQVGTGARCTGAFCGIAMGGFSALRDVAAKLYKIIGTTCPGYVTTGLFYCTQGCEKRRARFKNGEK